MPTLHENKITELMHFIRHSTSIGETSKENAIKYISLLEELAYDCFPSKIEPDGDVTYCCQQSKILIKTY